MSTLDEISDALNTVGFFDGYPTILLVTTSQYPTPNKDVNLLKFHTLTEQFPDLPLGFSDHTIGNTAASIACGMGSIFFEKHFTLDCNSNGPDHWFSANPEQLKNTVIFWIMDDEDHIQVKKRMKITGSRGLEMMSSTCSIDMALLI